MTNQMLETLYAARLQKQPLFPSEIADCIVKQRLLQTIVRDVLEQVPLVSLGMSHLAEYLSVAADDTLDGVV